MEHIQNGWDFSTEVLSDLERNKRANRPFQGRKNKKKKKKRKGQKDVFTCYANVPRACLGKGTV